MALKVSFADPSCGWVELTIELDDHEPLHIIGTYTPSDSFLGLINALHAMLQVEGAQCATWYQGSREVDLCFEKCAERISLTLSWFPERARTKWIGERLLEFSDSYRQVCMPFWRALRNLLGRCTAEALRAGWHREFPTADLDRLTADIEAYKVQ